MQEVKRIRMRIAAAGAALVLAATFGVMGATGIALARGDATTPATPAETGMVTVPISIIRTEVVTHTKTIPVKSKPVSV